MLGGLENAFDEEEFKNSELERTKKKRFENNIESRAREAGL
jgi:hypothetical protein